MAIAAAGVMGCTESTSLAREIDSPIYSVSFAAKMPRPPKDALPPDFSTHAKHVLHLDIFLHRVTEHPHDFQEEVEERRESDFGDEVQQDEWPQVMRIEL